MGYIPTKWKDHILSDDKYSITKNNDGTYFDNTSWKRLFSRELLCQLKILIIWKRA